MGKYRKLVSKLLSALCAATSKNLASVSVRHSLTETVFHFSVTLLRLVSSFHTSDLRFKTVLDYSEIHIPKRMRTHVEILYNKNPPVSIIIFYMVST